MMNPQNNLEMRFAEEMGLFFETGGIPRMAGRVWAYLLIVDAPYLSAEELGSALGASAGSISGATRFLLEFGLADRIRVPGERRDYFAHRPGAISRMLRRRLERLTSVELLVSEALERFGGREYARPRLDEIHDLYHWYARELPLLHARYEDERRAASQSQE